MGFARFCDPKKPASKPFSPCPHGDDRGQDRGLKFHQFGQILVTNRVFVLRARREHTEMTAKRAGFKPRFRPSLSSLLSLVLSISTISAISVVTAPSANAAYTTGSADFGSTNRFLTVANGGDFAVGTGDFTVEW